VTLYLEYVRALKGAFSQGVITRCGHMLVLMKRRRSRKRISWILIVLVLAVNAVIFAVSLPLYPIWAYMVISFVVALEFFSLFSLCSVFQEGENSISVGAAGG